jgi:hypothetical protein
VKSFVWDGIVVDGIWGTIKGLGTLVGFGGWEAMKQAWTGLAQLATGLALASIPGVGTAFWLLPEDKLPSWIRDSRRALKETGKALVAWDEWGKNPARAAGAVTFNVLTTVFTGGAGGAASGAGKAGAVARALSLAGKAGRVIDPMTYVGKAAGAGLSKLGDIAKAIKGAGKIDMPTLPDGTVHLPDGRLLDGDGNLIGHDGTIDTTPVPHEAAPQLPAHWTIQDPQPVYAGAHTGDGVAHTTDAATDAGRRYDTTPTPSSYDHTPTPSPYDHTPAPSSYDHPATPASYDHAPTAYDHTGTATTPHTGGHDVPGTHTTETPHGTGHDTPGGHTGDTSHGAGHDTTGHGHDGGGHGHDGGGHHDGGHDGTGHTDDTGYPDAPHDPADITPHHGTDAPTAPGHSGTDVPGHPGTGEPFEYKPVMSDVEFDALSDAEKHAVAEAELARGTNPAPSVSNEAGLAYGNSYWNKFLDDLPAESREALRTYSGNEYDLINGHLRFGNPLDDSLKSAIAEMDKVMGTRPVPEDIMVVRGTGVDHVKVDGRPIDSPLDMLGGTFDDKAFTSTALGRTPPPPFDRKPVWMHLRVPKDTPALWIDHLSEYPGERELLLARGSEYKVTRVFYDETHGKWHIYGEVLPRPKP